MTWLIFLLGWSCLWPRFGVIKAACCLCRILKDILGLLKEIKNPLIYSLYGITKRGQYVKEERVQECYGDCSYDYVIILSFHSFFFFFYWKAWLNQSIWMNIQSSIKISRMHTITFRVDKQWGPTMQNREQYLITCDGTRWKIIWEKECLSLSLSLSLYIYIYIYMTGSLCCTAEMDTTL